jgi:flagellar basal-body rod protein FlgB
MIEVDAAAAVAMRALDGLFMRQLATAHNLANANSPGFAPVRVSFEQALASAYRPGNPTSAQLLRSVPISTQVAKGESVRIDMEVSNSAENAMRYASLVAMLDRKMQILSLALREGRAQ